MRKTRFTFFIILVVLTAVLVFIIIGEGETYNDPTNMSILIEDDTLGRLDKEDMTVKYQNTLSDILYEYQQQILQQSISRENAVLEIRERVLEIAQIPTDLQSLHLRLVIALSRDLNGYIEEASTVYVSLQAEYDWLFSRFNFLVK